MPPEVTIRPATAEDRAFVERVYFQTQRYIIESLFGWRGDDTERAQLADCYDLAATSIVAHGRDDIGWMMVLRHPNRIALEHLYLDGSYQRRGIGTAILRDLMNEAYVAGIPLRLSTAKMNPARRLYERLGFRITGDDEFKIYLEHGPL